MVYVTSFKIVNNRHHLYNKIDQDHKDNNSQLDKIIHKQIADKFNNNNNNKE